MIDATAPSTSVATSVLGSSPNGGTNSTTNPSYDDGLVRRHQGARPDDFNIA